MEGRKLTNISSIECAKKPQSLIEDILRLSNELQKMGFDSDQILDLVGCYCDTYAAINSTNELVVTGV